MYWVIKNDKSHAFVPNLTNAKVKDKDNYWKSCKQCSCFGRS